MASERTKVLMLHPSMDSIRPRMIVGAQHVAQERNWEFYPITCLRDENGHLSFFRAPAKGSLHELLEMIRPAGVIIVDDALPGKTLIAAARAAKIKLPQVVHLGRPRSTALFNKTTFACGDCKAIASMALGELLSSGFEDFAYAPFMSSAPWDAARREEFQRFVALAGKRFHAFVESSSEMQGKGINVAAGEKTILLLGVFAKWLSSLPIPCGIMAANDVAGEAVLRAARSLGLEVPRQIAVVGVDDLLHVCETTTPTLSSVRRNFEGEGMAAAELLAERISRPSAKPMLREVAPVAVVRRASTNFAGLRDSRVAEAQEFIRLHACEDNFNTATARARMFLSRTQADRIFRNVTGHTILDEIHAVRIARAKEKLRAGMRADNVAAECGFDSYLDFRRVFKKITGEPVMAWKRRQMNIHG